LCPNDYRYARENMMTTDDYVRGYLSPVGNWATECTVGCNDFSACGDCECRCYGNDLYCADRWTDGVALAQTCSFNPIAGSDSRCVPAASFTAPTVVNGSCGTKDGTFVATTTAATWNALSYCTAGTNDSSPVFPAAGSSVSWNCLHGAVSASAVVADPAGSLTTAYSWHIRTMANVNAGITTQDIVYTTQSFNTSSLAAGSYRVYLSIQRRGVWSGWVYRDITVSNENCTATRSAYTCAGTAPNGTTQIMCPSDNTGLTAPATWTNAGTTSAACTAPKCQYYTPTYTCTAGDDTTGATMCPSPNDNSGLSANTPKDLVPSCGYVSGFSLGTPKCQFICSGGYTYNPATDTCVAPVVGVCGTKARTFAATDTTTLWNTLTYCAPGGGTASSTPGFPGVGATVSWNCNSTPCSATRDYYNCLGAVPSGSTACTDDDVQVPSALTWTYKGTTASSCTSTKCEYYTGPSCGTNAKVHSYSTSTWPSTSSSAWCSAGAVPATPTFPVPGGSVTWDCDGGLKCTASRQRSLNWTETSPSN